MYFSSAVLGKPQIQQPVLGDRVNTTSLLERSVHRQYLARRHGSPANCAAAQSLLPASAELSTADPCTEIPGYAKPDRYTSVLHEGIVRVQDAIERLPHEQEEISITDAVRVAVNREPASELCYAVRKLIGHQNSGKQKPCRTLLREIMLRMCVTRFHASVLCRVISKLPRL
jgi:hypothetical protein